MATGTQLEMNTPPIGTPPDGAQWTDRLTTLKTRAQLRWAEMEPRQRFWAIAAVVLLAAVAGFVAWYGLHTDWRVLYTGLDPDDARRMEQTLVAA